MKTEIDAVYMPTQGPFENPFAEAMPEFLSPQELVQRLYYMPELPPDIRSLPMTTRYRLATTVYEAFIPLDFSVKIYNLIYQGILNSYNKKSTIDVIRQTLKIRDAMNRYEVPRSNAFLSQAISHSILGASGVGKTSTITRVLNLFPQVIRHTEYKGQTFYCHQITYISIQCPADCSIKSVCFQIIDEINNLLFSDAPELQYRRNNITTDALVAIIAQLCLTHHIGVIVIDEIQNILGFRKNGANEKLIRFLVQLTNETGICVIMVGTPEVAKVFDSHQHIYRRTRGPRLSAISDMDAFYPLASALWSLQCTQKAEKMTIDTASLLFKITGGIPALLAELLVLSQEEAITSGTERLTSKLISRTAKENNFYDRAASMLKGTLDIIQDAADNCDEISPSGNDRDEHSTDNGKAKRKGRPKIERDAKDIIAAYEESGDVYYFLKQKGMVSD